MGNKAVEENGPTSEGNPPGSYAVGYGKPPVEHRFTKGRSGNPAGRPKRVRPRPNQVDTGYGKKAAEEFLRIEAYRPVTIREGDQVIELPAIQAVFRAMGVSAMKGNRFVQKTLAEMVARMEADHHAARLELFGTMVEYKREWEKEIERCRRLGLPEPEPVPHPDDVVLDPDTGATKVLGPRTREQKQRLDQAIARRTEAQEEVTYYADLWRRTRSPARKAQYLDQWHFEQRMFDIINDVLPERYKTRLQNRSYREGASQPGTAIAALRRDRKLREAYLE